MARSKCLTIVIIIILVAGLWFFVLPMFSRGASFTVTFYNEHQEVVHIPFSMVPYGIVTDGPAGQEVVSFTITVFTLTDDPAVGWCDFDTHIKVSYVVGDSVPVETETVHDGPLWAQRTTVGYWENGRSETTSPLIFIHNYVDGVPDDCAFYIEFTGNFRFFHTVDVASSSPVFTGEMASHTISLYHDGYTYDAYFGT